MKNPRHLFVLLGFLAQGLSWESYLFVAVTVGLWMLAVTVLHRRTRFTLSSEAIALLLGCAASILINRGLQRSMHFFLGDGLILLQVVRLSRPLTRREKLTSIIIACFHFGVLCTLAPNIRFVLLFIAAILLLPGALKETFTDPAGWVTASVPPKKQIRLVPSMRVCLWLFLGSGFVFLTAPRFSGTPLQLREGFSDQGSLLDSVLDPRQGGRANSQQVLLQIEGEHIGYLRCFALTEIDQNDGVQWKAVQSARRDSLKTNELSKEELAHDERFLSRKVFIKNSRYLGRIIPVDHSPVYLEQNFFSTPARNVMTDAIEAKTMWTTANNVYQYFIEKDPLPPAPSNLLSNLTTHLTSYPRQTAQLTRWLQQTTRNGTNSFHKARLLENYLRNNFTYQLGAPELDRLAPIDDFIFNRKEGHCERFAAAMALFMRMQGIPSRVVIGYVATTRNLFSGRLQVRFCDAHSWAEGYFPGHGWVTFDATPGPPPGGGGSDFWDMLEDLDFAWYSHIVNFNGFAQKDLAASSARLVGSVPYTVWNGAAWCFLFLLAGAICVRTLRNKKWRWNFNFTRPKRSSTAAARHFYEEMLRMFERNGLAKPERETPIEFLEQLRVRSAPGYSDAAVVTENFCHSFYGQKQLTDQEQAGTEAALKRLKLEFIKTNAGNHVSHRN
jgi:transglutaminase-like putative cysteine protease